MPEEQKPTEPQPPVDEPPISEPPAEDPPAEQPPAEEPPAEDPPAKTPPEEDPPAEDPEDDGGIEAAAEALAADVERAFAYEGLTGEVRATAKRFHTLARHVVAILPDGNARAVALAKLRKARGAVLRPILAV